MELGFEISGSLLDRTLLQIWRTSKLDLKLVRVSCKIFAATKYFFIVFQITLFRYKSKFCSPLNHKKLG